MEYHVVSKKSAMKRTGNVELSHNSRIKLFVTLSNGNSIVKEFVFIAHLLQIGHVAFNPLVICDE